VFSRRIQELIMKRNNSPRWGIPSIMLVAFWLATQSTLAQRPGQDPHLAYAFPAGFQRGTSCEIVVGGQYLKEADEVHLSGDGVHLEVIGWYRAMTQGEYNNLRMALDQAKEKLIAEREARGIKKRPELDEIANEAGITEDQQRQMQLYRERNADPKRQPNEQLQEEVTLKVTVSSDAELGRRELRMLTESSISNPLWLHVGSWKEVRETEPNQPKPDDISVSGFPIVINGQIMPGDIDFFSFTAKKGMRLVINAAARDVIPFLADAVPGWFQAVLVLTDSSGNEVAYADSFHYRQDPVIYFEVPRDDTYTIQIHDSVYRGREDFVYRLTIGETPFVTGVFPLGAKADSESRIELEGWNLTRTYLDVKIPSHRQYRPIRWFDVPQANGASVRFTLQIDNLPEVADQEPNNHPTEAQAITNRMIINGRIEQAGDKDVFRIEGSGRLVAEVIARRQGSPLDSMLLLTDESGKEIAFNDDHEDKSQALETHHADSLLSANLPKMGTYFLHLTDAQNHGGRDFIYRLKLRPSLPDFELRVVPSSIIAKAGATVPITVYALREDGYREDIALRLVDPPSGFRLDGGVVPGNMDRVRMTLTVPETTSSQPIALDMEGIGKRQGSTSGNITHPVLPAENMMQAFIWYHLVPVEQWNVVIGNRKGTKPPFQIAHATQPIKLPRGGKFIVPVVPLVKKIDATELRVELNEPPKGIKANMITNNVGEFAIEVTTDATEVQPGMRGNLVLRAYRESTPEPTKNEPAPKMRQTDFGYLPAIPFEVSKSRSH
jgi:hypothetical protein